MECKYLVWMLVILVTGILIGYGIEPIFDSLTLDTYACYDDVDVKPHHERKCYNISNNLHTVCYTKPLSQAKESKICKSGWVIQHG